MACPSCQQKWFDSWLLRPQIQKAIKCIEKKCTCQFVSSLETHQLLLEAYQKGREMLQLVKKVDRPAVAKMFGFQDGVLDLNDDPASTNLGQKIVQAIIFKRIHGIDRQTMVSMMKRGEQMKAYERKRTERDEYGIYARSNSKPCLESNDPYKCVKAVITPRSNLAEGTTSGVEHSLRNIACCRNGECGKTGAPAHVSNCQANTKLYPYTSLERKIPPASSEFRGNYRLRTCRSTTLRRRHDTPDGIVCKRTRGTSLGRILSTASYRQRTASYRQRTASYRQRAACDVTDALYVDDTIPLPLPLPLGRRESGYRQTDSCSTVSSEMSSQDILVNGGIFIKERIGHADKGRFIHNHERRRKGRIKSTEENYLSDVSSVPLARRRRNRKIHSSGFVQQPSLSINQATSNDANTTAASVDRRNHAGASLNAAARSTRIPVNISIDSTARNTSEDSGHSRRNAPDKSSWSTKQSIASTSFSSSRRKIFSRATSTASLFHSSTGRQTTEKESHTRMPESCQDQQGIISWNEVHPKNKQAPDKNIPITKEAATGRLPPGRNYGKNTCVSRSTTSSKSEQLQSSRSKGTRVASNQAVSNIRKDSKPKSTIRSKPTKSINLSKYTGTGTVSNNPIQSHGETSKPTGIPVYQNNNLSTLELRSSRGTVTDSQCRPTSRRVLPDLRIRSTGSETSAEFILADRKTDKRGPDPRYYGSRGTATETCKPLKQISVSVPENSNARNGSCPLVTFADISTIVPAGIFGTNRSLSRAAPVPIITNAVPSFPKADSISIPPYKNHSVPSSPPTLSDAFTNSRFSTVTLTKSYLSTSQGTDGEEDKEPLIFVPLQPTIATTPAQIEQADIISDITDHRSTSNKAQQGSVAPNAQHQNSVSTLTTHPDSIVGQYDDAVNDRALFFGASPPAIPLIKDYDQPAGILSLHRANRPSDTRLSLSSTVAVHAQSSTKCSIEEVRSLCSEGALDPVQPLVSSKPTSILQVDDATLDSYMTGVLATLEQAKGQADTISSLKPFTTQHIKIQSEIIVYPQSVNYEQNPAGPILLPGTLLQSQWDESCTSVPLMPPETFQSGSEALAVQQMELEIPPCNMLNKLDESPRKDIPISINSQPTPNENLLPAIHSTSGRYPNIAPVDKTVVPQTSSEIPLRHPPETDAATVSSSRGSSMSMSSPQSCTDVKPSSSALLCETQCITCIPVTKRVSLPAPQTEYVTPSPMELKTAGEEMKSSISLLPRKLNSPTFFTAKDLPVRGDDVVPISRRYSLDSYANITSITSRSATQTPICREPATTTVNIAVNENTQIPLNKTDDDCNVQSFIAPVDTISPLLPTCDANAKSFSVRYNEAAIIFNIEDKSILTRVDSTEEECYDCYETYNVCSTVTEEYSKEDMDSSKSTDILKSRSATETLDEFEMSTNSVSILMEKEQAVGIESRAKTGDEKSTCSSSTVKETFSVKSAHNSLITTSIPASKADSTSKSSPTRDDFKKQVTMGGGAYFVTNLNIKCKTSHVYIDSNPTEINISGDTKTGRCNVKDTESVVTNLRTSKKDNLRHDEGKESKVRINSDKENDPSKNWNNDSSLGSIHPQRPPDNAQSGAEKHKGERNKNEDCSPSKLAMSTSRDSSQIDEMISKQSLFTDKSLLSECKSQEDITILNSSKNAYGSSYDDMRDSVPNDHRVIADNDSGVFIKTAQDMERRDNECKIISSEVIAGRGVNVSRENIGLGTEPLRCTDSDSPCSSPQSEGEFQRPLEMIKVNIHSAIESDSWNRRQSSREEDEDGPTFLKRQHSAEELSTKKNQSSQVLSEDVIIFNPNQRQEENSVGVEIETNEMYTPNSVSKLDATTVRNEKPCHEPMTATVTSILKYEQTSPAGFDQRNEADIKKSSKQRTVRIGECFTSPYDNPNVVIQHRASEGNYICGVYMPPRKNTEHTHNMITTGTNITEFEDTRCTDDAEKTVKKCFSEIHLSTVVFELADFPPDNEKETTGGKETVSSKTSLAKRSATAVITDSPQGTSVQNDRTLNGVLLQNVDVTSLLNSMIEAGHLTLKEAVSEHKHVPVQKVSDFKHPVGKYEDQDATDVIGRNVNEEGVLMEKDCQHKSDNLYKEKETTEKLLKNEYNDMQEKDLSKAEVAIKCSATVRLEDSSIQEKNKDKLCVPEQTYKTVKPRYKARGDLSGEFEAKSGEMISCVCVGAFFGATTAICGSVPRAARCLTEEESSSTVPTESLPSDLSLDGSCGPQFPTGNSRNLTPQLFRAMAENRSGKSNPIRISSKEACRLTFSTCNNDRRIPGSVENLKSNTATICTLQNDRSPASSLCSRKGPTPNHYIKKTACAKNNSLRIQNANYAHPGAPFDVPVDDLRSKSLSAAIDKEQTDPGARKLTNAACSETGTLRKRNYRSSRGNRLNQGTSTRVSWSQTGSSTNTSINTNSTESRFSRGTTRQSSITDSRRPIGTYARVLFKDSHGRNDRRRPNRFGNVCRRKRILRRITDSEQSHVDLVLPPPEVKQKLNRLSRVGSSTLQRVPSVPDASHTKNDKHKNKSTNVNFSVPIIKNLLSVQNRAVSAFPGGRDSFDRFGDDIVRSSSKLTSASSFDSTKEDSTRNTRYYLSNGTSSAEINVECIGVPSTGRAVNTNT